MMKIRILSIPPERPFPNNPRYPLILYKPAIEHEKIGPQWFEERFSENGWGLSWRNGIYSFHHFHSCAHEVLGCFAGKAVVMFGGPGGMTVSLETGDALVIPAGVGHCLIESTSDFHVVGAYPDGTRPDTLQGQDSEYNQAASRAEKVPKPEADPLFGVSGPLAQNWS